VSIALALTPAADGPPPLLCTRCEKRAYAAQRGAGARPDEATWCWRCRGVAKTQRSRGSPRRGVHVGDAELADLRLCRDVVALLGGLERALWCARRLRDGTLVVDEGGE
jgi:hypothetical protein